jgi:hypothetical protein
MVKLAFISIIFGKSAGRYAQAIVTAFQSVPVIQSRNIDSFWKKSTAGLYLTIL